MFNVSNKQKINYKKQKYTKSYIITANVKTLSNFVVEIANMLSNVHGWAGQIRVFRKVNVTIKSNLFMILLDELLVYAIRGHSNNKF